jgi:hypothetical protein
MAKSNEMLQFQPNMKMCEFKGMMTDLTMANLTIISKKLVSQSSNEDLNSVTFKRYKLSTTHHAILQSFNQNTTIPSPVTPINAK